MLRFPFLKRFVVTTLGFNDFASVRIFINLQLARLTTADFGLDGRSPTACLWIEQIDHVFKAVAVFCEQIAKLGFEFDFFLQANITFESFESFELLGKVFFQLAEFCKFRRRKFSM